MFLNEFRPWERQQGPTIGRSCQLAGVRSPTRKSRPGPLSYLVGADVAYLRPDEQRVHALDDAVHIEVKPAVRAGRADRGRESTLLALSHYVVTATPWKSAERARALPHPGLPR
jgi:hypothetical protein